MCTLIKHVKLCSRVVQRLKPLKIPPQNVMIYDFYCSLHTLLEVQCVILTYNYASNLNYKGFSVDVCMLFALHMPCF